MSIPILKLLKLSETCPTNSGDQISPKAWIKNIQIAIALALIFAGTHSTKTVLIGPVA